MTTYVYSILDQPSNISNEHMHMSPFFRAKAAFDDVGNELFIITSSKSLKKFN